MAFYQRNDQSFSVFPSFYLLTPPYDHTSINQRLELNQNRNKFHSELEGALPPNKLIAAMRVALKQQTSDFFFVFQRAEETRSFSML